MAKIVSLALLLLLAITSKADLVCPDDWNEFSNSCYILMDKYRNTFEFDWLKASKVCRSFGGNLASIGNEKEMEFVRNLSSQQKTDHAWIGLVYWFQEGGYLWSDGTPFNSSVDTDWLNDKPCNHSGIRCVRLSRNGWNFTRCSNYKENQEFICEKPKGPLPCPAADWFLNGLTCYKASDKLKTWFNARRDCQASEGDLLKTDDKEEQGFIAFYLGMTGLKDATSHVWIGEKTNRACVQMSTAVNGLRNEENCEKQMLYVCEKQASDSRLKCFECDSTMTFKECPGRPCIFNDSQCYYASNQQGSSAEKRFKYGCTKQNLCNKTDMDGYFIQCCHGNLCNEVNKPPSSKEEKDKTTQENKTSMNAVAYISSGVALLLLLIVSIMVGIWCYSKSHRKKIERKARSQRQIVPLDKWEILPEQIEYEEELGRGAFGVVHKAILRRRAGIEVFETGKRLRKEPKKASLMVAVKFLQDDATEAQKEEFMCEIEQTKLLGFHQNIVSLVGCCTFQEHKFLVIEYVAFGDLLQWLRRRRRMINLPKVSEAKCYEDKDVVKDGRATTDFDKKEGDQIPVEMGSICVDMTLSSQDRPEHSNAIQIKIEGDQSLVDGTSVKGHDCEDLLHQELLSVPSTSNGNSRAAAFLLSTENLEDSDDEEKKNFSTMQLFCFAWQIAKGMNHLAENNFVHRDLAARNVLVGCDNKVKVPDFGLMRQIYEDVNSSENTKKLPVKWMAPEALYQNICTTKSDVWAFGILLWEMATLGGVPYPTLTNSELYHLLNTGYRMERPDMCCEEVYEMMTECWREDPCNRPSFFQLIEKLEMLMQMAVPYLDVSKHDEASPYYNVPSGSSAADDRVQ